jgi:hypothetical protein
MSDPGFTEVPEFCEHCGETNLGHLGSVDLDMPGTHCPSCDEQIVQHTRCGYCGHDMEPADFPLCQPCAKAWRRVA